MPPVFLVYLYMYMYIVRLHVCLTPRLDLDRIILGVRSSNRSSRSQDKIQHRSQLHHLNFLLPFA